MLISTIQTSMVERTTLIALCRIYTREATMLLKGVNLNLRTQSHFEAKRYEYLTINEPRGKRMALRLEL
ncbi:uncharacterized protein PHALS_10027 [Plasmopara halstedii]|uniref:Uncharacterized protein n=1 Tax=Plasmopara halstedii TaxID=4781 RepID=A0A0P1AH28_PLAHL|nr:uncharacterized protein PHALS_10027 [Plasmopara halstedii]CEG39791.1 hypothetical protein PHALS_10027 [Plasmopara halstedii]|eukprot:XP_024576160.1 hypothetical protein PHALS_10027 [Plasmopara halstedii]